MARTTGSGNRAGGSASGSPSSYAGGSNAAQKSDASAVTARRQAGHNLQTLQDEYSEQKYKVSSLYDKRNSPLIFKGDPEFKKLSADITREEKKLNAIEKRLIQADTKLRKDYPETRSILSHRSRKSNVFL